MKKRSRYSKHRKRLRKYEQCGDFLDSRCPFCGEERLFYYYKYDAKCCLSCNTWLEKACGDPNCTYCAHRPEDPLTALFAEPEPIPYSKDALRRKYGVRYYGKLKHEKKRYRLKSK